MPYVVSFSLSRSNGHTGCSSGYNSTLYMDSLSSNLNTSGREQMHAALDKLTSSFTQMSFVREALKTNLLLAAIFSVLDAPIVTRGRSGGISCPTQSHSKHFQEKNLNGNIFCHTREGAWHQSQSELCF